MLALDRLREFSGAPFDPAGTRGTLSAQVKLGMPLRPDLPPGSTDYDITVDLTNFSAEKMVFGHKAEAQALRVTANNSIYEIKGDVRVAGAPAYVEYRKLKGEPDAEVRLQATLDEATRARLGIDLGTHADRRAADAAHRPGRQRRARTRASTSRPISPRRRSTTFCRAGSSRRGGRRGSPSR